MHWPLRVTAELTFNSERRLSRVRSALVISASKKAGHDDCVIHVKRLLRVVLRPGYIQPLTALGRALVGGCPRTGVAKKVVDAQIPGENRVPERLGWHPRPRQTVWTFTFHARLAVKVASIVVSRNPKGSPAACAAKLTCGVKQVKCDMERHDEHDAPQSPRR